MTPAWKTRLVRWGDRLGELACQALVLLAVLACTALPVLVVLLWPVVGGIVVWSLAMFALGWMAARRFYEARRTDVAWQRLRREDDADLRTETGMDRAYVRGRTL